MKKGPAIIGAVIGAICAIFLTVGIPSFGSSSHFHGCSSNSRVPAAARDVQWSGDDSIDVRIPGAVHFRAAPEWHATAKGPADVLDHLRIRNGRIEFDESLHLCGADVRIELEGPAVQRWTVSGSGDLSLDRLDQSELFIVVAGSGSAIAGGKVEHTRAEIRGSGDIDLAKLAQNNIDIDIRGSGSILAAGNAERTQVSIEGSGDARLGKLAVKDATISIRGSGNVEIAPEETADVQIYGSGDVRLMSKPKNVQTRIHGSGSVVSG